jgi:hypothetical protein
LWDSCFYFKKRKNERGDKGESICYLFPLYFRNIGCSIGVGRLIKMGKRKRRDEEIPTHCATTPKEKER